MKYIVILGDGMADLPIEKLGGLTPLQAANKPCMDSLSRRGELGLVHTIPEGMSPGSDTANLAVLGYNPRRFYTGRSPLEAVSMGILMEDHDISFRCNVVTLTEEESYWDKTILDHSADEITTDEAKELIFSIQEAFNNEQLTFYPGVSYRHAMIWKNGSTVVQLTPPHDILEKKIQPFIPSGDGAQQIKEMMEKSYDILSRHPVNLNRKERGLRPANSIWIWGEGKKPALTSFKEKYGLNGSMISAVDLLKGIGIAASMKSIDVEGANGTLHTNYAGKVQACLQALQNGSDFAYVHVEAPDECGHRGELANKVMSIEILDQQVVQPIVNALDSTGTDYRLLILPDHPTPIALRTHTSDAVPYLIYDSTKELKNDLDYDEISGAKSGKIIFEGYQLMDYFLQQLDSFKKDLLV